MKQTYGDEIYHYTRDEQETSLRCQICHAHVRPLFPHRRVTESTKPNDMLVLCQDCADWADVRKRTRTQRESDQLLMQIAFLAFLFIVIALVIIGLAFISPLALFAMMLVAFFLAYLIVLIVNALGA